MKQGQALHELRAAVDDRNAVLVLGAGFTVNITRGFDLSWSRLLARAAEDLRATHAGIRRRVCA